MNYSTGFFILNGQNLNQSPYFIVYPSNTLFGNSPQIINNFNTRTENIIAQQHQPSIQNTNAIIPQYHPSSQPQSHLPRLKLQEDRSPQIQIRAQSQSAMEIQEQLQSIGSQQSSRNHKLFLKAPPIHYYDTIPKSKKEILVASAKKNCEANICHHFRAFLKQNCKHQVILRKILGAMNLRKIDSGMTQTFLDKFYEFIEKQFGNRKKYINFKRLIEIGYPYLFGKNPQKQNLLEGILSVDTFCCFYRRLLFYFFRVHSVNQILTANKIKIYAYGIHLRRRRLLINRMEEMDPALIFKRKYKTFE